jgi:hypothetical protein
MATTGKEAVHKKKSPGATLSHGAQTSLLILVDEWTKRKGLNFMAIKQRAAELSKNQKALAGLVQIVAYAVIAAVVLYCDIQFIQVMWRAFPDGIVKIFSLIGAVATGASVLALIGAEAFWFSRGPQMLFGWIFTAIEVIISSCNVILSFEMSAGHIDQFMSIWLSICPATPVVAALCWIVVFNLDQSQKARHDHREMQDDIAESDREHERAVHESKMKLKTRYLESTTTYLEQISNDPRIQAGLEAGAWKFAAEELRNLTGMLLVAPDHQNPPAITGPTSNPPAPQQLKTAEEKPDPATPPQTANLQPTGQEIAAAMLDMMKQQQAPVQAQFAEPSPAAHAESPAPRPVEDEYVVNRPEPVTDHLTLPTDPGFSALVEKLSPLVVTPTKTNGNGVNGHSPNL